MRLVDFTMPIWPGAGYGEILPLTSRQNCGGLNGISTRVRGRFRLILWFHNLPKSSTFQ